ncbi:toxin-antitoxin system YwqK family antitoxin [Ferruginibacter sp.]
MRRIIFIAFLFFFKIASGQKTYLDSSLYDNGQLERKGLYYQVGNQSWQWGIWEYWYEDGKKQLEVWEDTVKTRYINMWAPDGTQILRSGNGYYYSIEPQPELTDSLVYEIKDSIKSGIIRRFRSYGSNPYFLVETGFYENEKEAGVWHFKDTVLKTTLLRTYKNGEQNGLEVSYFMNGKVKDSVNYFNDRENGNYKAYSEQGILIKDCNYKGGRLIDYFKEYFTNGQLRIEGQYTQAKGYIKVRLISIGRGNGKMNSRIVDRLIDNKPLKQGVWKYYNEQGKLVKTEKYLNGKRI